MRPRSAEERREALARISGEVARARETNGISQAEAARAARITVEHYGRIERGETLPSVVVLANINAALGLDLDAIFAEEPDLG